MPLKICSNKRRFIKWQHIIRDKHLHYSTISVTRYSDEKIANILVKIAKFTYIKAFINWWFWANFFLPKAFENHQNCEKLPNLVTLYWARFEEKRYFVVTKGSVKIGSHFHDVILEWPLTCRLRLEPKIWDLKNGFRCCRRTARVDLKNKVTAAVNIWIADFYNSRIQIIC